MALPRWYPRFVARRTNMTILVTSMVSLACGSRSALFDPGLDESPGGTAGMAGGAGLGASGGSGGAGDGGGVAGSGACHGPLQVQPTVTVLHPDLQTDLDLAFTRSTDDGGQVAVAFVRKPVDSPFYSELRHTSFEFICRGPGEFARSEHWLEVRRKPSRPTDVCDGPSSFAALTAPQLRSEPDAGAGAPPRIAVTLAAPPL